MGPTRADGYAIVDRFPAPDWLTDRLRDVRGGRFLIKWGYEVAGRRLNVPKTARMPLAAGLFFITPALQNLDVAFQGLSTWHSHSRTSRW